MIAIDQESIAKKRMDHKNLCGIIDRQNGSEIFFFHI